MGGHVSVGSSDIIMLYLVFLAFSDQLSHDFGF